MPGDDSLGGLLTAPRSTCRLRMSTLRAFPKFFDDVWRDVQSSTPNSVSVWVCWDSLGLVRSVWCDKPRVSMRLLLSRILTKVWRMVWRYRAGRAWERTYETLRFLVWFNPSMLTFFWVAKYTYNILKPCMEIFLKNVQSAGITVLCSLVHWSISFWKWGTFIQHRLVACQQDFVSSSLGKHLHCSDCK